MIANTGERIPEEDLPRVCELFFTGNKSRGGEEKHLGIGLYLAGGWCSGDGEKIEIV